MVFYDTNNQECLNGTAEIATTKNTLIMDQEVQKKIDDLIKMAKNCGIKSTGKKASSMCNDGLSKVIRSKRDADIFRAD